jgi:DNA-binding SARP family transcriptional activator/tetratricopeptide (TPR) repeat protein
VLAVLVLELGRVVPPEQLIDRVWGTEPPSSVRNVLYGYVAKLRTVIDHAGEPGVKLGRRPGGYSLQADQEQVDLYRFRHLTAQAASAAGDDQRAEALLGDALGLWHGSALAGLDSPWLAGMRNTLELQRLGAVLDLGDIALRQGRHNALISDLVEETVSYATDERLIGQLMLALYRSGRQAEALRWFEQTRQHLAAEFGAGPGPGLQALHQQILRADPSLAAPTPGTGETWAGRRPSGPVPGRAGLALVSSGTVPGSAAAVAGPGGRPPRELPADVTAFAGRTAELAELDRLLTGAGAGTAPARAGAGQTAAAVISAVSGTAGVGKTALAVHWAHRAGPHFPDGQLYVNLRGYDPGQPMTAAEALAGFLRSLGVAGQDIPANEDERASRYRSLLAGRRVLVVADNASDAAQVRPLLPGAPGCAVLVTSRDALSGLVARDGATRLDLDLLPRQDAVGLLRVLIGDRVDADPGAAAVLAERCALLPLALRVAVEFAVARPDVPLADLAGELAGQQTRLDLLQAGGDSRTGVRAVFSWSYQHLDLAAARAFRLLGLHPGPGFEANAAAALTGTSLAQARTLLGLLARAHLIQPAGPGRYGMHDLLRAYARELGERDDSEADRQAALARLFDHYLHTAADAVGILFPAEASRRGIRASVTRTPGPAMTAPAARAWLDAEQHTLVAIAGYTARQGWPGHTTRLSVALSLYLDTGGCYAEAITLHSQARDAARRSGDRAGEARALADLGLVDWRQDQYETAAGHFRQALARCREIADRAGEARVLTCLGSLAVLQDRYRQAVGYLGQALARCREVGDKVGEAHTLTGLGFMDRQLGHHQQAAGHFQQALALYRGSGDRLGEARALCNYGVVTARQGRYREAAGQHWRALALFREIGDRYAEAHVLAEIGAVDQRLGRHWQAARHLQQALPLFRETGDRAGETEALNRLGETLLAVGQADQARLQHVAALSLASLAGDRYEQTRAHRGLAAAHDAAGDFAQARQHRHEAHAHDAETGGPDADRARAQLAVHGSKGHRPW